jgi:colanic acid biosynthesis glycosyl transferase WcaI
VKHILVLVQSYHPDTVSSAQHVTDLSEALASKNNKVTVICSKHGYDSSEKYSSSEIINNVTIYRLPHTKFGKNNIFFRIIDFFTLNFAMLFKLIFYRPRVDEIISLTSPPFSGILALIFTKLKSAKLTYWVMDLQPELSISSGLISESSITAKIFKFVGDVIIKNANKIIALDRHMTKYLISRGAVANKILNAPVWPATTKIYDGHRDSNPFRIKSKFNDKLVVMYSGNHSQVHPLTTLLNAATILKEDERFHFAFVGGGVRVRDVKNHKLTHSLENISLHAFQPRETFHISIAASDIQVVIMGKDQVGFTHPNKIYGAMLLAKPILYIGPRSSHVTDILNDCVGNIIIEHDDTVSLTHQLKEFIALTEAERAKIGQSNREYALNNFKDSYLIEKHVKFINN